MIKHARLKTNDQLRLLRTIALLTCFSTAIAACSFQKYVAKPIEPANDATKFELKDPLGKPFTEYLLNNGYTINHLPIQQWGLDELTYCALFFHPSLDVARAQWLAAQASETKAAQRPAPTLNGNLAHSDDSDPTKKPFAFGLNIDLPIETANKREIRIESAQHLSKAAKLEIAQLAWQLRHNVAQSLTEYEFNQNQLRLLSAEELRREEIVSIYQKRVTAGAASNIELSNAKLQLQTVSATVNAAQQNKLVLLSRLASNIGLPLAKVATISLSIDHKRPIESIPNTELQSTALLNRLDIRIALEHYASAEAKLKLEIAGQYPDIVISPGAAYEFGDNIWSLGLSGLLSLLNKNKVTITDATMLREVEAAQFEALQTKVILEANIANAEVNQAKQALEHQQRLLVQQQSNTQRMQRKLAAGDIDKLEMTYARLEDINAEKNVAIVNFQLNKSLDQLENTLQKPLAGDGAAGSKVVKAAIKLEGEK